MPQPSRPTVPRRSNNNGSRSNQYGHQPTGGPTSSLPEPSQSAIQANVRKGRERGRSQTNKATNKGKKQQQEGYAYKAGSGSGRAGGSIPKNEKRAPPPRGKTIGHYVLSKSIGEGTFGKVRSGTHIITGEKVAVKILEKSKIIEVADVRRVTREINILKKNRHRNIIQLFEVIDKETTIYLIMENADGGELFDYIVQHQRIAEPLALSFFKQICDGAEYLHKMEVTHRDLKPENLLLQSSKEGWIVKIVDFGLSNTHEGNRLLQTACGSPCYAAPEMIHGYKYVGPKADIWSMGVILFAMVCGHLPFENSNTKLLYAQICAGEYKAPDYISTEVRDLIRRILNTDPEMRLSIEQIRRHPWFQTNPSSPASPMACGDKMTFDSDIIQQLQDLKINTEQVKEALRSDGHNFLTASYYLLSNRKRRNKEKQELREQLYEAEAAKNRTALGGSPKSIATALNPIKINSNTSSPANPTRPSQIPKLALNGVVGVASPTQTKSSALPKVTAPPNGKPPKQSRQQRQSQRQQPTGSQTSRVPSNPAQNVLPTQPHSARAAPPPSTLQQQYPDGAPVAAAPWDVAGIERPVTRSSSRGEGGGQAPPRDTVPDQVKATVGLLGVTPEGENSNSERQKKGKTVAPTIPMNEPAPTPTTTTTPVAAAPSRPSAPGGGRSSKAGAGGRKIIDPTNNSSKKKDTADTNNPPTSFQSIVASNHKPAHNSHNSISKSPKSTKDQVPTVVSSTSSKPMKALYNEMNKACKAHNIKVKPMMSNPGADGSLSITCTTQLISTSPTLIFTLEVQRLGDIERMYVLKGSMQKGKVSEFEKVCRVLFNAMKLV
ncbi:hypothetical protein TrLO_g14052 [Triparma laevis f. longispina]|uniref:Non-specific serine/threonine protein kinase n=1 Tax=Triparma laevis f. longispina TaxID=1714387 RepID=A0A9W7KYB5_9STRA|nr:hypothetical protein TrLO_g14052 [Triparma laevis f. longispina]